MYIVSTQVDDDWWSKYSFIYRPKQNHAMWSPALSPSQSGAYLVCMLVIVIIDVKKRFLAFLFIPVTFFTFFNVFVFSTFIENSIKKFEKHFWNHRNKLMLRNWLVQCRLQSSTLGSAYSDTTAVTSCNRHSQYMKSWIATNWKVLSVYNVV